MLLNYKHRNHSIGKIEYVGSVITQYRDYSVINVINDVTPREREKNR